MTIESRAKTTGRLQLLLIAAVFAVPLVLATWMYYVDDSLAPDTATNNGNLLLPIVNLNDVLPRSGIHKLNSNQWLIVYADMSVCRSACADALVRLRQSRLMLGKDMRRVRRVFLHGDSAPDTVVLEQQHPGLITMTDKELGLLLEKKRPAGSQAGGLYLLDPLGNLVMYFSPNLNPKDVVDDIKHLLKLSHIG